MGPIISNTAFEGVDCFTELFVVYNFNITLEGFQFTVRGLIIPENIGPMYRTMPTDGI